MFATAVQPPILSLFSSRSTACLSLFSTHTDPALPSDSFVHVLDDASSLPAPPAPRTLIAPAALRDPDADPDADADADPAAGDGLALAAPVLHIQSPTLPSTYIRCPPHGPGPARGLGLGIALAWLHLQVRDLGRAWSFEVGVVDRAGRAGRVRCSTFQKRPVVRAGAGGVPLLHLPLRFPPASARALTAWCTVRLHLPAAMAHFAALPAPRGGGVALPSAQFAHVSSVTVFANCRLSRIWFTHEAAPGDGSCEPWEFGLYAR